MGHHTPSVGCCDLPKVRGAKVAEAHAKDDLEEHGERHNEQSSLAIQEPISPGMSTAPELEMELAIPRTRRRRSKKHLEFVASQPCLVCGRSPSDAHHLGFTQPRALGRKVSDEFTVPLCRSHHRMLHARGNEPAWWKEVEIDPLPLQNSSGARR